MFKALVAGKNWPWTISLQNRREAGDARSEQGKFSQQQRTGAAEEKAAKASNPGTQENTSFKLLLFGQKQSFNNWLYIKNSKYKTLKKDDFFVFPKNNL